MSAMPRKRYTEAEYLELEHDSDIKHEYHDGEILAMAGASREHLLIVTSSLLALGPQLRSRPCELYANDMRVQVVEAKRYFYPDLSVVCGEPEMLEGRTDTLLNPGLIIEVLSPSTANYDRVEKFRYYRQIPSLQDYVLIAQDRPHIECFSRNAAAADDDAWTYRDAYGLEASLAIPSIGCTLALAEVYERITFEDNNKDNDTETQHETNQQD